MDFKILHKWFHKNHMVLNPGKRHYIVIRKNDSSHKVILNNNEFAGANKVKLWGIHLLDSKLNFVFHARSLCKKAGQKLSVHEKINYYLAPDQKILLLNSVGKSKYIYVYINIYVYIYKIHSKFQSEYRKIRTRKNCVSGHFSCSVRAPFQQNIGG